MATWMHAVASSSIQLCYIYVLICYFFTLITEAHIDDINTLINFGKQTRIFPHQPARSVGQNVPVSAAVAPGRQLAS